MKKFFSLVEIALAIAIIGIGMAGIMALFPIAFQSSRNAIGENYSADTADIFLAYIASKAQEDSDWSAAGLICNLPTARPDGTGTDDDTNPAVTNPPGPINWTNCGNNIYAHPTTGVYRVYQGCAFYDFQAGVRIWKKQIDGMWIYDQSAPAIDYKYAARLYAEISWPVGKLYSKREKRIYCMEIFKQR